MDPQIQTIHLTWSHGHDDRRPRRTNNNNNTRIVIQEATNIIYLNTKCADTNGVQHQQASKNTILTIQIPTCRIYNPSQTAEDVHKSRLLHILHSATNTDNWEHLPLLEIYHQRTTQYRNKFNKRVIPYLTRQSVACNARRHPVVEHQDTCTCNIIIII